MCGIAGIYIKNPDTYPYTIKETENAVDWLFCGIEKRGTHASGIAVQTVGGESFLEKSDMPGSKFIFWRRDLPSDPRIILQHTRYATKGKPENLLNNHPVQYENIYAIHNGHISNDDELFKDEELARIAEVDSEIIPALLHKYTFDNPKEALEKMLGGFAIAAFDQENPGTLLLAKGTSSPLVWIETSDFYMWASEEKFLVDALMQGMNYESKTSEFNNMAYGRYAVINGDEMSLNDFSPKYKTYTSSIYTGTPAVNRPYSDGWMMGGEYVNNDWQAARDKCDECFIWFPANALNDWGNQRYCDHCDEKLFTIKKDGTKIKKLGAKKVSRKEKKRIRKAAARRFQESRQKSVSVPREVKTIADALETEHWDICTEVASYYGTKPYFVNWLLFGENDVDEFDDPNLIQMADEFQEKYQELLETASVETDKVIAKIRGDEAVANAIESCGL